MKNDLGKSVRFRLNIVAVCVLVVLSGFFASFESRLYYQRRENNLYLAGNQARLIEGSMDTVMARVYSLRSLVKANNGNTDFFMTSAQEIYEETQEDTGLYVKNLILAPNGIVKEVYPLEGNESLIGLNYLDTTIEGNEEAFEAYRDNKLVLTEPFTLKQGGTGIAGRLPVFTDSEHTQFWGMVAVTLDMDFLLEKFNLNYLEESGTNYCLSYTSDSGERIVLAASKNLPKNPISYTVTPGDLNWILEVAPSNGWISPIEIGIGVVIILVLTAMLYHVLSTRAKMRSMNEILEELAIKDNLTGCFSRHYVSVVLLSGEDQKWRDPNASYSLAVVDVDRFKQINDNYGHEVGDKALKAIAEILKTHCDELRGDCVIRYGGDEFIFLMNHADAKLFEERLNSIVQQVRKIRIEEAPDMRLSVSCGGVIGKKNENYHQLFARADRMVYEAKETGKDRYCIEKTESRESL